MSDVNPEIDVNIVQILNVAASKLQTHFLTGSRGDAKQEFKKLKQGKSIKLASMNISHLKDVPLNLQLDYSEYRGPGFGFDSFIAALMSMLRNIETALKEKKDLNILSSQDQSELVLAAVRGTIRREEQINVMVMSLSFSQLPYIILKLMFVDPGQFEIAGNANL